MLMGQVIETGDLTLLRQKRKGCLKFMDRVEAKHAGYLRELFRYAQKTLGYLANFTDLANCMSAKSDAPGEQRMSL